MATVYKWTPFEVALDITATSDTVKRTSATEYTVKINVSWETYYEGAQTNYGMSATSGGVTKVISAFGTSRSSGSSSFTGTYSISGNGSATKTITVTFKNYEEDWEGNVTESATKAVTFDVTVPAWTSYTVSYNANGGSDAPSSQKKWKDQTLTLSSTKPTRTGYTFSKWNTESDGSGTSYSAGASYTANSAVTLYAIWTENKLTVNYYSNYATSSSEGVTNAVSADKNVLVKTASYSYSKEYKDGLWNYTSTTNSFYLLRIGYTGTQYWGTSTSGGTFVHQAASFSTGQEMAQAFGKSLASGNASVNIYPQWEINTYTFVYNANGGSGSMSSETVNWNEAFTLSNNTFKREGYKFIGWNAYRNNDDTWYVSGQGWLTEDEISSGGYEKKLYENQSELTFSTSWIKGDEYSVSQYTMYAIWEISGVVYIDNGTTLEPYLVYIDNGSSWDLYLAYVDDGTDWNIIS